MGFTNKGKVNLLKAAFQDVAPTNWYLALITNAAVPTPDTNTFSELTEIASGNGYTTGGYQLDRNAVDFDTTTEDDSADTGSISLKDIVWTASGGSIPSSGAGATYAVLLDDNPTVASREVWAYMSLGSARSVTNGANLTLQDTTFRLDEP